MSAQRADLIQTQVLKEDFTYPYIPSNDNLSFFSIYLIACYSLKMEGLLPMLCHSLGVNLPIRLPSFTGYALFLYTIGFFKV